MPVVGVNGTQEHWIRERDALQEMDQVSFFRPITKWAYSIPSASKLQEALTEPWGPVHVEASRDVLLDQTEPEPIDPAAYRVMSLPDCSRASLDRAWELLSEAERPVLLAGSGVAREGAREMLVALAEKTGISSECVAGRGIIW